MKETKCVWKERRRELVRCWDSKSEQLFKVLFNKKQNKTTSSEVFVVCPKNMEDILEEVSLG